MNEVFSHLPDIEQNLETGHIRKACVVVGKMDPEYDKYSTGYLFGARLNMNVKSQDLQKPVSIVFDASQTVYTTIQILSGICDNDNTNFEIAVVKENIKKAQQAYLNFEGALNTVEVLQQKKPL
jgi:hypothetical protein